MYSPRQYQLPDILSLFTNSLPPKSPKNPHFEQLDAEFTAWIASFASLPAKYKKTIIQTQMPFLVALVYPDASFDQLQVCLRYMLLSLVLEVLTDNASGQQCQTWTDIFIAILNGQQLAKDIPEAKHPLCQLMHELTSSIIATISPTYRSSFIAENVAAAESIVMEAHVREAACSDSDFCCSLVEYMKNRQATIGLRPFLVLERWVRGIRLSDRMLCHPMVMSMVDAAVEMVYIANDIYSYKKEARANEAGHNILTVIMHDPSTGIARDNLQGAFDYALDLFRGAWGQFVQSKMYLQERKVGATSQVANQSLVERYAEALMDCVIGNIQWSLVCDRYSLFENEDSRERMVIAI